MLLAAQVTGVWNGGCGGQQRFVEAFAGHSWNIVVSFRWSLQRV